jgi:hypothetical protein
MKNTSSKAIEIDPHWEPVLIENGVLFLNNVYGHHIKIKFISPAVPFLFNSLKSECEQDELLTRIHSLYGDAALDESNRILTELIERKIVVPSLRSRFPGLADPEFQRFRTQLWWLEGLETGRANTFSKFRDCSVAIIGLGGVGSLCAFMLAAAGVGGLTLVDGDTVEESNLVRQVFYTEQDACKRTKKVDALAERLREFSRFTKVDPISLHIDTEHSARSVLRGHDLVVQTADAPRIILNREINSSCTEIKVPVLYAFVGQVGPLYIPGESACFGCLEALWSEECGHDHEKVVAGLKSLPTMQQPSIVSGAVQIADALFVEAFGFLTEAYDPFTKNGFIRFNNRFGASRISLPRQKKCPFCNQVKRRP